MKKYKKKTYDQCIKIFKKELIKGKKMKNKIKHYLKIGNISNNKLWNRML